MNRLLKLTGQIVGLLLALYIVIIALLFILVKTKNLNPIVAKIFYQQTGQVMHIDGEIALSIFPWPAVRAENITIDNPRQFKAPASIKYFAKIGKLSARLRIVDLFYGNIQPTHIMLDKIDLNLVTARSGKTNWGHLTTLKKTTHTTAHTDKTESTPTPLKTVRPTQFPVIDIHHSNIHFINLQTRSRTDLTNFSLSSPGSLNPLKRDFNCSTQIKHDDPETRVGLKLVSRIHFNPEKSRITLSNIAFSAKWFQVQHVLPTPIVLIMYGKATIHNKNFGISLEGGFAESTGTISLDTKQKNTRITAVVNMKQVSLKPLIIILTGKNWIDGKMNLSTTLITYGKTFENWIRNLSGKGNLEVTDGKIKGMSILSSKQKNTQASNVFTPFKTLSADYTIRRGLLSSNNFLLDAKTITTTGKGRVNFPNQTINATLLATYVNNPSWKIPLTVTGPLFSPIIQPDRKAIAEKIIKKEAQKGLGKTFENLKKQFKSLFD